MASTDPILGLLQQYAPMAMPLVNWMSGDREIDFDGRTLKMPATWENMGQLSRQISNALDRENVEEVMTPVSREVEQFHRSMARSINKGIWGMDDTRADQLAKNRASSGRILAWILGKSSGIDGMVHNMEVAAHQAGVRPSSLAGQRVRQRNQRVSNLLATQFARLVDPENRDKMGMWSPLEASRLIALNMQEGRYEDVMGDSDAWGAGNRLTSKGAKTLEKTLTGDLSALSAAAESGLVSGESPDQAQSELRQMFGYNPLQRHDAEGLSRTFQDLGAVARSTGIGVESVRQLAPKFIQNAESPSAGMGALKDFLIAQDAATRTGVHAPGFNEEMMKTIQAARQRLQVPFSGVYAIAAQQLGQEKADEIMQDLYNDQEAMRGTGNLLRAFQDRSGIMVDRDQVTAAAQTEEGDLYMSQAGFVTPYLSGQIRDEIMDDRKEALRQAELEYMLPELDRRGITMDNIRELAQQGRNPNQVYQRARQALESISTDVDAEDAFLKVYDPKNTYMAGLQRERRSRADLYTDWGKRRQQEDTYTGPFDHLFKGLSRGEGWGDLLTGILGGGQRDEHLQRMEKRI